MVPAIKGSEGLDFAGFHSYYEELITKTRENKLTADDFQGTNISLTNPGGIGTVASVPRLLSGQSAIIATGSIAYPPEWTHASPERLQAARRLEGDDADLDLRPPGDPGRRVGRLPAPDRAAAAGRGRLLRGGRRRPRHRRRRRSPPPTPPRPRRRRSAPPPPSADRADRHRDPARRGAAAGGAGRDLAAQGLPHPRPPRRPPRPARLASPRATRRSSPRTST